MRLGEWVGGARGKIMYGIFRVDRAAYCNAGQTEQLLLLLVLFRNSVWTESDNIGI